MTLRIYPQSLFAALALAAHGLRKGSLNRSGALAAAILGYATLANPLSCWAAMLLVFYFGGSRATKVKADIKATLEQEGIDSPNQGKQGKQDRYSQPKHKAKDGGQRNATQVLCNALTGKLWSG